MLVGGGGLVRAALAESQAGSGDVGGGWRPGWGSLAESGWMQGDVGVGGGGLVGAAWLSCRLDPR